MIIKSITIENMKAVRDILHIEFSQYVNLYLLVGKNSSGKSTVLEAIRSACWNPPANVKAEFFSTSKPKVYKVRSTKGIYDYLSSSRPGVLESDFKALLRNYDEEELAKLGESVSRIVSNDIKILSIKKERDRDIKILINGVEIAPQDLSSGIQAILTIEAMLNYPRARTNDLVIFLIEEPEVFLHPNLLKTYARRFLDFAKERKNTQLFISTHSPILLSF
ncbi:MAG: AAA family ATPase, partial [Aquificaceae bacterium]